jgi:hypothetical protein
MSKLTPVSSQNEFYPREELNREVHREVFDMNHNRAQNSLEEIDSLRTMVIASDDEAVTENLPSNRKGMNREVDAGKRPLVSDDVGRPPKRRDTNSKGVSSAHRKETVDQLLNLLNVLPVPETVPDLLRRTAERLEHDLFEKISKDRPVNALGRSSTLLTAATSRDLSGKYRKEKEIVLGKVEAYVETATREDGDIEDVQQGEIWDVIRVILDESNFRT